MGRAKKPTAEQLETAAVLKIEVVGNIGATALQKLIDAKEEENLANAEVNNAEATNEDSQPDSTVPETDTDIDGDTTTDASNEQDNEGDLVDNSGTEDVKPEATEPVVEDPKPVVKEETKPTIQAPVVEDEEAEVAPKLDAKEVASIITHADYTGKQKIQKIFDEGQVGFSSIASKIIGYDQIMNPKTPVTELAGVAKQYDLLNTLKSVINTEDYKQFKVKFDIINLGFRAYNKDAFDEFMLFRFDQKWKWSKKDLTTFQHLSSIISQLCDLTTRANNLKKIDINRALDASEITLSETGISNLKKYYTM